MSRLRAISSRPVAFSESLDIGDGEFRANYGTKADPDHNTNDTGAISSPDRNVKDVNTASVDVSDSGEDQTLPDTPRIDSVTDQTPLTATAHLAAGNHNNSAPAVPSDSSCEAVAECRAGSGDHRKVFSHLFGRNKAETRGIPKHCWIRWCRKHYQRFTYRESLAGNWHKHLLRLVREQLDRLEDQTDIQSWRIALRKKEQRKLDIENAAIAAGQMTLATLSAPNNSPVPSCIISTAASSVSLPAFTAIAVAHCITHATKSTAAFTETAPSHTDAALQPTATTEHEINLSASSDASATVYPSIRNIINLTPDIAKTGHIETSCTTPSNANKKYNSKKTSLTPQLWERFLVPYLGTGKTFAEARTVCDVIEREFSTPAFQNRDRKKKVFPGVEFLPLFPNAKGRIGKTKVTTSTTKITKRKASDMIAAAPATPAKRLRLVRRAKV
jgi:hypothetical protein